MNKNKNWNYVFPKIAHLFKGKKCTFPVFHNFEFWMIYITQVMLVGKCGWHFAVRILLKYIKSTFFSSNHWVGNFIKKCTYTTGTWRNNNVIVTPKRRCDVIMTLLRRVSGGYALIYLVELPNSFPMNSVDKWEYIFIKFDWFDCSLKVVHSNSISYEIALFWSWKNMNTMAPSGWQAIASTRFNFGFALHLFVIRPKSYRKLFHDS